MKEKLYFIYAKYLRFFSRLVFLRWNPIIIVIIGSAGKTTLLNLLNQLLSVKSKVKYSKKANSAIGIPLFLLDIMPTQFTFSEWSKILVLVPFRALYSIIRPETADYLLLELDADRQGEMRYFSQFIQPQTVVWLSSFASHTAQFQSQSNDLEDSREKVAYEFSLILSNLSKHNLAVVNTDSSYIKRNLTKTKAKQILIKKKANDYGFSDWTIYRKRTTFKLCLNKESKYIQLPYIVPENFGYTLVAIYILARAYKIEDQIVQATLENYLLPAGRTTVFEGINNTRLIDSSYNSSLYASKDLLEVLASYPGKRKVAVLGDMRELGNLAKEEHEELGKIIIKLNLDLVVLVGPLMEQYLRPYLLAQHFPESNLYWFTNTYQAALFLKETLLKEADTVLIKASQNTLFFELITEMLLLNKNDLTKLCRREPIWESKRKAIIDEFYKTIKN